MLLLKFQLHTVVQAKTVCLFVCRGAQMLSVVLVLAPIQLVKEYDFGKRIICVCQLHFTLHR